MFFNLTGRLREYLQNTQTASRPPASNTNGSRPKGGIAHGGDIPYGSQWTPLLFNDAVGPDDYSTQWYSCRIQLQCYQPSGGPVRVHQPHGRSRRPCLRQSIYGLRLNWQHLGRLAGGYPHRWPRVLRFGGGFCWHGSNSPNGSTGPVNRYRRPAKPGGWYSPNGPIISTMAGFNGDTLREVEMEPATADPP